MESWRTQFFPAEILFKRKNCLGERFKKASGEA
jgi:hypothetical protein